MASSGSRIWSLVFTKSGKLPTRISSKRRHSLPSRPNATDLNNDKDFVDAGEAGLDPATSLTKYEIISRREFVWQLGAASRIMDLDFDGAALVHPDGKIDQNEIDIAKAKGALKVEVLATPAVDAAPADKSQDLWFGNTLLSKIDGSNLRMSTAARTPTVSQPSIRAMCLWPA